MMRFRVPGAWPAGRVGNGLATVVTALAMGLVALTGWLLAPEVPDPPYVVEFATARAGFTPYSGTILGGGVEPFVLRPGPSARSAIARRALEQGAPAGAFVIAGPATPGVAPVFALYDTADRTVVMVAVDSADVVFQQLARAARFGLATPRVRIPGALAGAEPEDTLQVAVRRTNRGLCVLQQDGGWDCGHGFGAASGWRVLLALDDAPPATHTLLGVAWLALLAVPIGLLARWHAALALGVVLGWYVLIRVPLDTVLVTPQPVELLGIAVGLATGLLARRLARARRRR
jgi:hypothetical protein